MLSNTGINKIILLGQVTKAPELTTSTGQTFWCFCMVTIESIKKGHSSVEHNEYHNIRVTEKLMLQEDLTLNMGQIVYVEGKIQTTAFIDDMHIKRYNLEIIANKVEILNPTQTI